MTGTATRYFDADGTPKLRLSYCGYMDMLGFSEISSEAYQRGEGDALLATLHGILSSEAQELKPAPDLDYTADYYATLFTDNVVLGHVIDSKDGESEFGHITLLLRLFQLRMALEGFFVRDALTVGDLFMDDNLVLGPALLEAHSIEQTMARDARIVLSDTVFKIARSHLRYYGPPQTAPHYEHILLDSDGKPFLNYLGFLFEDGSIEDEESWHYAKQHKQHIEDNLVKHQQALVVWAKYQWLSGYHNYICSEAKDIPGYDENCLISSELVRRQPSRIVGEA